MTIRTFSLVSLLGASVIWSTCSPEDDMCGTCLDRRDVLLPLQVGNTWRYVDRPYGDSLVLTVKKHVRFGGKCFAVLIERRTFPDKKRDHDFRAIESPLYLSYGPRGEVVSLPGLQDIEVLKDSIQRVGLSSLLRTYYDPWAQIDSAWTVHEASAELTYPLRDIVRISRDSAKVEVDTPAGTFENCIVFVVAAGHVHADYMAPGVGMISRRISELGGGEYVLTSYDLK